MFEGDLDNAFENKHALKEEIPEEGAAALAGKKTQETLTATDLIIERLDIAEAEKKRIAEHQVYTRFLLEDNSKLMFHLISESAEHACIVRYPIQQIDNHAYKHIVFLYWYASPYSVE